MVDMVRETVNSESFLNMARKTETAFTRVRKISMMTLFLIMANMVKSSTQTALNRHYELIGKPEDTPTQQAFSKARQLFSWKALRMLLTKMVSYIYSFRPKKRGVAIQFLV
jgi:hypothetical protein